MNYFCNYYFRQEVSKPEELVAFDLNAVYDFTSWDKMDVLFNFSELANNRPFITNHLRGLQNIIAFQRFRFDVLNRAVSMCNALASEVGEPCFSSAE